MTACAGMAFVCTAISTVVSRTTSMAHRLAPLPAVRWTIWSRRTAMARISGFGANMLSTSFIGLRGKQEIAEGLYGVFNFQTLFNSGSGKQCRRHRVHCAEQWFGWSG